MRTFSLFGSRRLDEIREPRHGWRSVRVFWRDARMHVLLGEQGGHFFAVTAARWDVSGSQPVHREDSPRRRKRGRRPGGWFLDNPAGSVAELLASHPHDPVIRELLLALNEGDLVAGQALEDRLVDRGIGKHLFGDVKEQLLSLGVWRGEPKRSSPPELGRAAGAHHGTVWHAPQASPQKTETGWLLGTLGGGRTC